MEDQEQFEDEAPLLFRCPISMELMSDPVTVATGVTYERRNIVKWLYTYKKTTCPATMQPLSSFDLTPNTTLRNLINSWHHDRLRLTPPASPVFLAEHDNLVSLLATVESAPFKVSSLKKLHSLVESGTSSVRKDFVRLGGIQLLAQIMSQALADFAAFRACEESLAVLRHLPLTEQSSVETLSSPDSVNPMMLVLQRGGVDARLHALTILQNLSAASNKEWMLVEHKIDVIKTLLELLSDEISPSLSAASLDVLTDIVVASKKNRHKAVEAGAVCVLVELLPDAGRHKCERILYLIKHLCGCPEGRAAFGDHGLGVVAVSKKILRVSDTANKLGVKILFLACSFAPKERVIEDMMVFGAVRKLIGLLHVDGRSSTKEKAVRMLKMHGGAWRQYPCFPCELMEYLRLLQHHHR